MFSCLAPFSRSNSYHQIFFVCFILEIFYAKKLVKVFIFFEKKNHKLEYTKNIVLRDHFTLVHRELICSFEQLNSPFFLLCFEYFFKTFWL